MSMTKGEFVDGNIVVIYNLKDTPYQVIIKCSLLDEKEDMDKFINQLNESSEYDLFLQEFEHDYSEEQTTLFLGKKELKIPNKIRTLQQENKPDDKWLTALVIIIILWILTTSIIGHTTLVRDLFAPEATIEGEEK